MARSIEFARLFVSFEAETKGLQGELDKAEKSFDRLAGFIKKNPLAATGALGAAAVTAGFQLAKMAEEVNKAVGFIVDRVPGATGKIDEFRRAATDLAIQFGVTQENAIATMDAVSRAGVANGEELVTVTKAAIEAGKALGKNGEELVGGLDAALDLFGISADNARAAMAHLFDVAQGRTSVEDLLATIEALAPVIEGTGLDFITTTQALTNLIDQGFEPGKKTIAEFKEELETGGVQAIRNLANEAGGATGELQDLTTNSDDSATAIRGVADAAAGPNGAAAAMDRYTEAVNRNSNDIESNTTRAQTRIKAALIELGDKFAPIAARTLELISGMFRDETGLKGLQFWKTEVAAAGVSAAAAGKSFQQLGVAGGTAAGAAGQMTDVLIEAKNATSELGSKSVEDLKKYQAAILAAKDAGNLDKESKAALLAITKELAKRTKDFNDAQKKAAAEQARHLLELVDQYNALLKPVTKLTEESNRQSVGFAEAAQRAEENAERLRDMLKEFAGGDMNEIERLQRKVAEILEKQRREAEKINQEEEKRKAKLRETAEKIKDVAQGLLGVAQAAGVFSAETAAALHNLLAIGDAVKDIALSDKGIFNPANFTNLISAAGALAGVISSLFGESPETAARKELLEKNTQALRELTEVQGDILRINQPGARLQSAEDAIRAELSKSFPSFSGLGRELAKVGLSIADLEEIAQDLGISLRNPETGKLEGDAIRLLLEALEKLDVGFEETFRGAMDRLEALMAAGIIKPTQELAALADILTRGPNASSAISDALKDIDLFGDPDGAVAALQELIERFGRGELTKGELGGLSGDEFLDAILDLIRLLQDDQEDERLGSNRDPFDNPDVDETPRGGEIGDIDPFEPIRLGNEEAASFYEESLSIDQLQLDALNRLVEMGSPVLVAAPSLPSGGGGSGGISVVFEAGAVALSALPGEVTEDVARRAGEAIAGSTITAIAQQVDQIQGSTSRVRRVLIDGAVVRAA